MQIFWKEMGKWGEVKRLVREEGRNGRKLYRLKYSEFTLHHWMVTVFWTIQISYIVAWKVIGDLVLSKLVHLYYRNVAVNVGTLRHFRRVLVKFSVNIWRRGSFLQAPPVLWHLVVDWGKRLRSKAPTLRLTHVHIHNYLK